jgi:hypothetical protein
MAMKLFKELIEKGALFYVKSKYSADLTPEYQKSLENPRFNYNFGSNMNSSSLKPIRGNNYILRVLVPGRDRSFEKTLGRKRELRSSVFACRRSQI